MTFEIEKGVPIPESLGGRRPKYPWHKMGVGDSFFVTGKSTKRLSAAATQIGRRHDMKFICRAMDGGVRVWRIE